MVIRRKSKKPIFRYFKPFEIDMVHNESYEDISESFGYFAFSRKGEVRFLDRYSSDAVIDIMNSIGLIDHLRSIGFNRIIPVLEKDEALVHYLKIYHEEVIPDNLLIDLRLSEKRFIPDETFFEKGKVLSTLDMIVIEWLTLQNPFVSFDANKPQLPGQKTPGLGALQHMMNMMYVVGRDIIRDGFLDIPEHIHGAIMYSTKFTFFNPLHEAIVRAILRDLGTYSLIDISWGILTKSIIDTATDNSLEYVPSEQIFALSSRLQDYFNSKQYRKRFHESFKKILAIKYRKHESSSGILSRCFKVFGPTIRTKFHRLICITCCIDTNKLPSHNSPPITIRTLRELLINFHLDPFILRDSG